MTETAPPPKRRRRRALRATLAVLALVPIIVAGGVAFLLSEAGLPFVVARVIAESDGRLSVEGASGSLASTVRIARLDWRGVDSTASARDVVVEWNPFALFSRRFGIRGLGASSMSIAVKPSSETTSPPSSLALPLAVDIDNVAVTRLDWQQGPHATTITGLTFGYSGSESEHRIRNLKLVSDYGALNGDLSINAAAPFAISGGVAIVGDGPIAGATLGATGSGTLTALVVDASGKFRESRLVAQATVAPFAQPAFQHATATVDAVDLTAFHESLPHTRLTLTLDTRPQGSGYAGSFRARNDGAGTLDEQRVPVAEAAGRYAWSEESLGLSDLALDFPGGGRASGDATIDLSSPDAPSRWKLAVRDLDLARLHSTLIATRLSGSLDADIERARQTIVADLREPSLAVAFAATYERRRIEVTRLRAESRGGVLTGAGRIVLDAPRAFDVSISAQRFDPARFAALPSGSLSGTIKATGVLVPEWKATANVDVAQGSRLSGVALSGSARGTVTRRSLANAVIDLTAGSAKVAASGSAGAVGDRMAFTIDAPSLADLRPLLPPRVPTLDGKVRASGAARIEPGGIGGDIDVRAESLRVAGELTAGALTVRASFAPGGSAKTPTPFDARPLSMAATGSQLAIRQFTLSSFELGAIGTLAAHTATVGVKGASLDATAQVSGGLSGATGPAAMNAVQWSGQLVSLINRGDVPLTLAEPAALEVRPSHIRVANARVRGSEGYANIDDFTWDEGRVTTHGAFAGISLARVSALAEQPFPLVSTLKLGGNWSITAVPRLSGSFVVRRESGDIWGVQSGGAQAPDLAFGIETLELAGALTNDALDAKLVFRSARAGSAQGTLTLGSVAGAPPGRIAKNAPLGLALDAQLASLAPLQPWLGTAAVVNGNATVALTARGTLDAPMFSGTVAGDALRVDSPQFGIYLRDGRVRAHLADGAIALDELAFEGGDGRFTASGTVAARGATMGQPRTQIAWKAENLRITNRPDLRLVVGGEGTLAIADKRLAIKGKVNIVDGKIEYNPSPPGQLGPDVVVVGRPPRPSKDTVADLPLALDVEVSLGSKLTFTGSGLDTSLTGSVHVRTAANGRLDGSGSIQAVHGTYYAFGQKLTIDRGRLLFDGALDNPALDIVALRKNLAVEAGVEVTGTAKVPRVRITSNPPVPENEALAWLITGQAPGAASGGTDYAALSAASAALLSKGGKPLTAEIAQSLGLDDITVRSGGVGNTGVAGTTGQVIVFGKRITDRLTIGYEQGLSIAANAVRLEYTLTNTVTLRAEAGIVSGVGVYYRRSYD